MHGGLGDGGEWGRQRGLGTYCTGIAISIILSCKDSELVAGGAYGGGWEGMHVNGRFQKVGMFWMKG